MTEDEWFSIGNPDSLMGPFAMNPSRRKFRLFAIACCHHCSHATRTAPDELYHSIVELAERYADGLASDAERQEGLQRIAVRRSEISSASRGHEPSIPHELNLLQCILKAGTLLVARDTAGYAVRIVQSRVFADVTGTDPVRRAQSDLFREIFINPFQPVAFDPSWRTTTVVSIAKSMYDSRDFSPMPLLADALQDAGCEHTDFLDHCRSTNLHVRGCWVVDLVLGKE